MCPEGEGASPARLEGDEGRNSPRQGYLGLTPRGGGSLLGSTGSIGTQTLDIVREYPDRFSVKALAAGANVELLAQQCREFRPELAVLQTAEKAAELKETLADMGSAAPEVMWGDEGACAAAAHPAIEATVTGIVGCAGLTPTVRARFLSFLSSPPPDPTPPSGG